MLFPINELLDLSEDRRHISHSEHLRQMAQCVIDWNLEHGIQESTVQYHVTAVYLVHYENAVYVHDLCLQQQDDTMLNESGCRSFEVEGMPTECGHYGLIQLNEIYSNVEAFQIHEEQEYTKKFRAERDKYLISKMSVHNYGERNDD